jgi:hypothetical protein
MSCPKPPSTEDLETFLRCQDADTLVSVLLDLARDNEDIRARLGRLQWADRPDKLSAGFRKTLSAWRRPARFRPRREALAFGRELEKWLDQVAQELLPQDPPAALDLFQAFIEADADWFHQADDSNGAIGTAVRAACGHWLRAAARCETAADAWPDRLLGLYAADRHGAREPLLQQAHQLLGEDAQRAMVAQLETRLSQTLQDPGAREGPPLDTFRWVGALSLLAASLRDPDIKVRASLQLQADPHPVQREVFARAYLEANRPADALTWLQGPWGHLETHRLTLQAQALEQLGRVEQSAPIRQRVFERTLSHTDLQHWIEHLPESARTEAIDHANRLAREHGDIGAAAALLLHLDDPRAAEECLLAHASQLEGRHHGQLDRLAESLRVHDCPRGETVVYRALLTAVLEQANFRAYGSAAGYWKRLKQIADSGVRLAPLPEHEVFTADVRVRHARKTAFWARVEEQGGRIRRGRV